MEAICLPDTPFVENFIMNILKCDLTNLIFGNLRLKMATNLWSLKISNTHFMAGVSLHTTVFWYTQEVLPSRARNLLTREGTYNRSVAKNVCCFCRGP